MPFFQEPPSAGDPYAADDALRSYLDRALPEEVRREVEPELAAMGALSAGPLRELWLRGRDAEPRLTTSSAGGERVDAIELTALWRWDSAGPHTEDAECLLRWRRVRRPGRSRRRRWCTSR